MSVIAVAYSAVAAGNLLLGLGGNADKDDDLAASVAELEQLLTSRTDAEDPGELSDAEQAALRVILDAAVAQPAKTSTGPSESDELPDVQESQDPAGLAGRVGALAASLSDYATDLVETWRWDEALDPALDAVHLYRWLAEDDPDAHRSELASALNAYSIILADVGEWDEALEPAHEAVNLYRELAADDPAAHQGDLAMSLSNYAHRLGEAELADEALEPALEALQIRRGLAKGEPATFSAALASSLSDYANMLRELGRWEGSLEPALEAADLYRDLARRDPKVHERELATSLSVCAQILSKLERWDEALQAAEEAVGIRRVLAQDDPAVHNADLATSLSDYANNLAALGRLADAVEPAAEAVEIHRGLAEASPVVHNPALASSLSSHAELLLKVGRRDAALETARQARALHRELAGANPPIWSGELAELVDTDTGLRPGLPRHRPDGAPMDITYPSDDFPGLPGLRLAVPEGWMPLDHPDAVAGAVDPESPTEFTTNLLVLTSRVIGDYTLDDVVERQVSQAVAQLGGKVERQERRRIGDVDSVWTEFTFPATGESGVVLFQTQVTVLIPRVRDIADAVTLVGTCAAGASERYAPLFEEIFLSLAVTE